MPTTYNLPKSLDFSDLAVDVHSDVLYGTCTAINGTSFAGSATSGDEIIINIPRAGSNCLLIPSLCKFRATLTLSTSGAIVSGVIDSIFRKLEIRCAGEQLEYIDHNETI